MARKGILATLIGLAAFAVPNAFADKGGVPHEGSNGQGRPVQEQQAPAATPQGKALAKGHAKTHAKGKALAKGHAKTHAKGKALAKGHAKTHAKAETNTAPQAPPATNTHAKAGKTTICHATGSATNPYVTITISNNAIPAHQRHQDGRDIIPAPAGGCPAAAAGQTQAAQQPAAQQQAAAAPTSGSSTTTQPSTGAVLGASG